MDMNSISSMAGSSGGGGGGSGVFQAIAEIVKQGMRNIANSGKNAQVNGAVAKGGVGLLNPDFKKTDSKEDETSVAQTTEDSTDSEVVEQEPPVESGEGEKSSDSGSGLGMGSLPGLGGGGGGGEGADIGSMNRMSLSDAKAKDAKDVSSKGKADAKSIMKNIGESLKTAGKNAQINGSVASFTPISTNVVSDERLKEIFGAETPIDCFAKIHAYEFKYTPKAQEIMQGQDHVDDKEHFGVMAQELLMNPATSSCVIKDTDGFLKVDTAQLTMANTAIISELSRKVQKLEEMLGER